MKRICKLSFQQSIDTIKDTIYVYFKSGVWNEYRLVSTNEAIRRINNSGYGADVDYNEKDGMYYVCCPCNSDMW